MEVDNDVVSRCFQCVAGYFRIKLLRLRILDCGSKRPVVHSSMQGNFSGSLAAWSSVIEEVQ